MIINEGVFLSAFAQSILGCHGSLYRYARSLCGEPWDAEELVQETYRRALAAKRKPDVATADEVRPWMFTILRNIWHNERRRISRSPEIVCDAAAAVASENGEAAMGRKLLVSEVRAAVDSLPAAWREVIVMRDVEDLSYAEMAEVLGCPAGTVMSRLARARAALRALLVARPSEVQQSPEVEG